MSTNFKHRTSRKRKYNPHDPTTLYTLIHLEWQSECYHLNPIECCGDITREEEYQEPQRKRRKFVEIDDDSSEEVDSEPDQELDDQLALVGLLSEASVLGMQKVKRMEVHRKYMKVKRDEELKQSRLQKQYREVHREERVNARADRRQRENAPQKAKQDAIQRVMKKEKAQARYDQAATKVNVRFRGGKQAEEYYSYDDDYDDDDYYDDDDDYEEESYKPYDQPVCLVGDDVLGNPSKANDAMNPFSPEADLLEQALLNSLQETRPDTFDDEEMRKALEASISTQKTENEEDEIQKAIQASLETSKTQVDETDEEYEALARALHEQLNFSEEPIIIEKKQQNKQQKKKGVWGRPPKVATDSPFDQTARKDVWGRKKTWSKAMKPSGGTVPITWATKGKKKRNQKAEAKRIKDAEEEELAYNLALIASMEEKAVKQNVGEDEPLDVIGIDDASPNLWACSVCTYFNGRADTQCLMCGTTNQTKI